MTIRDITTDDVNFFENNVRLRDKMECEIFGYPAKENLEYSWKSSVYSNVLVDKNDKPIAFGGIIIREGVAFSWLLTTDLANSNKKTFMKYVKSEVEKCYKIYGPMMLATDARYEQALKLNEWAGFKKYGNNVFINNYEFVLYRYGGE